MMRRAMIGGLVVTAALLWASQAAAETCTSDDDCGAEEYCATKGAPPCLPPACPDGEACDESPDCPEAVGECVRAGEDRTDACESDDDCDPGFSCEEVGATACGCAPGMDCGDCEPEVFHGCVPADCESDEDCGEGQVCLTEEMPCTDTGSTPACPPDAECPDFEEPEPCEPETRSQCAPMWAAPCEEAEDCGPGFDCEFEEICSCSGGGGVPTPGGSGSSGGAEPTDPAEGSDGEAPDAGFRGGDTPDSDREPTDPDDPGASPGGDGDCTCEPADEKSCVPREIECSTGADCPSEWTCEAMEPPSTICVDHPDGESDCEERTEPEGDEETRCVPPWFDAGDYYADDPASQPQSGSEDSSDRGAEGNAPPADDDGHGESLSASSGDSTGCQGGSAPLGLLIPALAALALTTRRRRLA